VDPVPTRFWFDLAVLVSHSCIVDRSDICVDDSIRLHYLRTLPRLLVYSSTCGRPVAGSSLVLARALRFYLRSCSGSWIELYLHTQRVRVHRHSERKKKRKGTRWLLPRLLKKEEKEKRKRKKKEKKKKPRCALPLRTPPHCTHAIPFYFSSDVWVSAW